MRENALKVPNAALRFRPPGWSDSPKSAALAGPLRAALEAALPQAHAQQAPAAGASAAGAQLRAFRERLERELALSPQQRSQLDEIFGGLREKYAALRDAPESERAKLAERIRVDLRARIGDILDEPQKKKYAEILVELGGRSVARGRVFVPGPDGAPVPLELRIGLSDGIATEVLSVTGGRLEAGDPVYVGLGGGPGPAKSTWPARPAGPRL